PALLDPGMETVALLAPLRDVLVRQLDLAGAMECPVERHPDRDLRRRVVATLVELPHPGVLVGPEDRDAVDAAGEHLPRLLVEHVALRAVQRGGFEQIAPRAELDLRARRIPVAHRSRVEIAAEVVERLRPRRDAAVEIVERPQVRSRPAHGAEETRA